MAQRNVAKSRRVAGAHGRVMRAMPTAKLHAIAALTTQRFDTAAAMTAQVLQTLAEVLTSRTLFLACFEPDPSSSVTQRVLVVTQVSDREGGCHVPPGKADALLQACGDTIAATVTPLVIADVVADPLYHDIAATTAKIGSFIGVPLLSSDGGVFGVLGGVDPQPLAMDDMADQTATLQIVAQFAGAYLERNESSARIVAGAPVEAERERALTQAQELEAILTAVSDGLFVYDAAGHLIRMNPAGQAMLGLAPTQLRVEGEADERVNLWMLRDANHAPIPPDQWPLTRILRGEQLAGENAMDIWMQSADGHERLISTSGAPMRGAEGSISGAVTLARDVTMRRHLEYQTQQALTALLRMAQASVKAGGEIHTAAHELALVTCEVLGCRRVGVMAIDAVTQYIRPLAVVGLTAEEEEQWWAMQPADTRYDAGSDPEQLARFEAGEALVLDMTQPPLDQMPNPFGVTTALYLPMRLEGRMVGILSLDHAGAPHEYTAQELALAHGVADLASLMVEREQLLVSHAEAQARELALQQANVHMHTFLGIAGHELRTPVTSIKANVQLAERGVRSVLAGAISPEIAARLTRVDSLLTSADRQIERLIRLIGDLLDVTRIEAGKLDLQLAPSDLATVVREAIAAQRLLWPQRDITLTVAADVPAQMSLDAHRIEQVVTNYLTNALKYTSVESPVAVTVTRRDAAVEVAVIDQGPGIPQEAQGQLWDLFHQVEGIPQQNGSSVGLGLGLYICQTLIARHGGQVGVTSTVGQGATFWFTLPITPMSES